MASILGQSRSFIHVAVGVIFNLRGQVLISKRADHVHQGGLWEFPGGKLKLGENIDQGLKRELKEELGITVISASPLIQINHSYDDRHVFLDVWKIGKFNGEARGLENQPVRWVWPEQLSRYCFPKADDSIITALRLPEFYPFLENERDDPYKMQGNLDLMIKNGIGLVRLRAKNLSYSEYEKLAVKVCRLCSEKQVKVMLNSMPDLVAKANAAGLHLNSKQLMEISERPLDKNYWVAASCHNSKELRHAEEVGVDFVVLSPVHRTPSHPNSLPLGWDRFESMVSLSKLPVFALGGMSLPLLRDAKHRGAQGIAGIRAFCQQLTS